MEGRQLLPSAESLAHRARLARLISPLRRVRPRVPFYALAAHRVPTLWCLYRGLLRAAPGENVRRLFSLLSLLSCRVTEGQPTSRLDSE
jgi:hypothetical protein